MFTFFQKVIALIVAIGLLVGLPAMANAAGVAMTGSTKPIVKNSMRQANVLPMLIMHGKSEPITAPIADNNMRKGNNLIAVLPRVAGQKVKVFVGGSRGSGSVIAVNLFTWRF